MIISQSQSTLLPSLNSSILTDLHENQYAIIDDFLPLSFANQLLDDANRLYAQNYFQQHYFQFGGSLLKKPNIYELDLTDPSLTSRRQQQQQQQRQSSRIDLGQWDNVIQSLGPSFVSKIDELETRRQRERQHHDNSTSTPDSKSIPSPSLALDAETPPAIKVQLNTGGGSFPWHYDNPGPPNQRSLTCVVYLNPHWKVGDGGEIVLWPFLSSSLEIPPLHRRAVLFWSDRVLHRVLPSRSDARRVCFSMWCHGKRGVVNSKEETVLSKDVLRFGSYDEAEAFFRRSALQRVLSRAVYGEEYLESLLECLVVGGRRRKKNVENGDRDGDEGGDIGKEGTEEMESEGMSSKEEEKKLVRQHEANVAAILTKLRPLIDEFRRRKDAVRGG
ncbi:hypothetical protein ACHAXS_010255 [Conticribra weissflogii]